MSADFSPPLRLQVLAVGFLVLVVLGAVLTDPVRQERARLIATTAAATTSTGAPVLRRVTTTAQWRTGLQEGTAVADGAVRIARPAGTTTWAGTRWTWSRWTSAWTTPGPAFTQLVPSWDAVTPSGTWIRVQTRVRSTTGAVSGWKTLASWSTRDDGFRRTSAGTQRDAVASVATDTVVAGSGVRLTGYQLRLLELRRPSSTASPTVRSLQAVASRPAVALPATSRPLLPPRVLVVPRYSQMTHRGQYPQWGGGGQAWCSPTSLAMVLGYFHALPPASTYAWVDRSYADPWVDHVARAVYDHGYSGAGNWAFNTAYAANRTDDAFVTRLVDLRDAERFVAAGIPLVVSISFSRGQLTGAPISSTAGHLVVVVGFTRSGDVVVNDPAAPTDATVRRTYDRSQFERAWLRRSGGAAYVVHNAAHPLPARSSTQRW